jgi:hypothetical protein
MQNPALRLAIREIIRVPVTTRRGGLPGGLACHARRQVTGRRARQGVMRGVTSDLLPYPVRPP